MHDHDYDDKKNTHDHDYNDKKNAQSLSRRSVRLIHHYTRVAELPRLLISQLRHHHKTLQQYGNFQNFGLKIKVCTLRYFKVW
jgi:hypothetical protein